VTVQIGAVLLLAIIFAALVLYQVNTVPAENSALESTSTIKTFTTRCKSCGTRFETQAQRGTQICIDHTRDAVSDPNVFDESA